MSPHPRPSVWPLLWYPATWLDPVGWLLLVPALNRVQKLQSLSKNYRESSCFPSWLMDLHLCLRANTLYLISYSIKILLQTPQRKLKPRKVLLDASIFLSWVDPTIKFRNIMIPSALSCKIYYESFTAFTEAQRNNEVERLSTPNELSTTFTIWFSASCNTEYVPIGTLLSTNVIKFDKLWPPLREPNKEVRRAQPDLFLNKISETSSNRTIEIGYWLLLTYNVLGLPVLSVLAPSVGLLWWLLLLPLALFVG